MTKTIRILFRISIEKSQLREKDFPSGLTERLTLPNLSIVKSMKRSNPEDRVDACFMLEIKEIGDAELCTQIRDFITKKEVQSGAFDLLASVVTDLDHGGLVLPDYVQELLWHLQCKVGFSFMSIQSQTSVTNR